MSRISHSQNLSSVTSIPHITTIKSIHVWDFSNIDFIGMILFVGSDISADTDYRSQVTHCNHPTPMIRYVGCCWTRSLCDILLGLISIVANLGVHIGYLVPTKSMRIYEYSMDVRRRFISLNVVSRLLGLDYALFLKLNYHLWKHHKLHYKSDRKPYEVISSSFWDVKFANHKN